MGRNDPSFLVVGQVKKPHGTKGELFVRSLTDHPEGIYAPGVVFRLGTGASPEPDPDLPPLRIEAVREVRGGFLVRFAGIETRTEAELVRGRDLFVPFADVAPLADDEVFYHDLVGMSVETENGRLLGVIEEVYELRPHDLLEVRGDGREYMIPFAPGIVVEVDTEARRVTIDPPDGLLEL